MRGSLATQHENVFWRLIFLLIIGRPETSRSRLLVLAPLLLKTLMMLSGLALVLGITPHKK